MPNKNFDPHIYKNKKTINVATTGFPGVSRVYDWSKRRQKYIPRSIGNKYYVVKWIGGKQDTKCFVSLDQAKIWKADHSEQASCEAFNDMLFEEVQTHFLDKKRGEIKPSTFETLKRKCKHLVFFHNIPVREITPKHIDFWLKKMKSVDSLKKQHKARAYFKHELSALRQVLEYFGEYLSDEAFASPVKKRHSKDCFVDKIEYKEKRARDKKRFLSGSEINRFLNMMKSMYADKPPLGEAYYFLSFFQLKTGTRIGEAAGIYWEDICFERHQVNVNHNVCWSRGNKSMPTYISGTTKNGLSRVLPLHRDLVAVLKSWQLKSGRSRGLVFSVDERGEFPLEYRNIVYRYDKVLEAMGSEWRGTHLGRHSFATDFMEKTGDHRALQGMLGHQTSKQTDQYAKMTAASIAKGMKVYESVQEINIGEAHKLEC